MADDATKISLAELKDESKYVCKKGVPWFRAHKKQIWNDKLAKYEELEVLEADLSEIADNMKALEREGRAFRITNGHIEIGPGAKEKDQPELLGLACNARVGKFGPKQIPCVMVDEYIKVGKVGHIEDRIYRSAEFYRQRKNITGAAALLRDPQLNLGVILYGSEDKALMYGEPVGNDADDKPVVPEMSNNEDDLSPEEVKLFERLMAYMQKTQQAQMQQQNAAMGPMNAMPGQQQPPQPSAYQESQMSEAVAKPNPNESPEFFAMKTELESNRKRLADIEPERTKEKSTNLLDRLEHVEHYKLDRADELEAMCATDDAGRAKIAARIRKNHQKVPGSEDEVTVAYSDDNLPLPGREPSVHDEPENYQETLDYMRENGEYDFEKAQRIVNAKK